MPAPPRLQARSPHRRIWLAADARTRLGSWRGSAAANDAPLLRVGALPGLTRVSAQRDNQTGIAAIQLSPGVVEPGQSFKMAIGRREPTNQITVGGRRDR